MESIKIIKKSKSINSKLMFVFLPNNQKDTKKIPKRRKIYKNTKKKRMEVQFNKKRLYQNHPTMKK